MKRSIILAAIILFCSVSLSHAAGVIALPQTGQTKCWNSSGTEIACIGTGQDGETKGGAAWPNPRFTYGTGTEAKCMIDNLTGLMWPKNGNLAAGTKTWSSAIDYANNLTLCGHDDWRLPNVNELESLVNANESSPATWLNTKGFTNVQSDGYWSSSTRAVSTDYAWIVYMGYGYVYFYDKTYSGYVWPVRAGQGSFGPSALWRTGQTATYRAGDDGATQQGVAWPAPRFTDNGNQSITDNLNGLVWTKDANAPGSSVCSPGVYKTWQTALDYVKCLNTSNYLGYNDWRLPNRKELRSLSDYSRYSPSSLPSNHPFTNVQSSGYWSSSTYADDTGCAWVVSMGRGYVDYGYKSGSYYVWPVRAGRWSGSFDNLVISKSGTGTGTVKSSLSGILCGSDCSESYSSGKQITLTATPDAGSTFDGWSGCDSISQGQCLVTIASDKTISVMFNLLPPKQHTLTIAPIGTGSGKVLISVGGKECDSTCVTNLDDGTQITLTPEPYPGSSFVGWYGSGCAGLQECKVTIKTNAYYTAKFEKNDALDLFIYPEDNWVGANRPVTYKHQGDLLDIVVSLTNQTGKDHTINLELEVTPADALNQTFNVLNNFSGVKVFKRGSAEELASREYDIVPCNSGTDVCSGSKITLSNLAILQKSKQPRTEFVFRFQLKDNVPLQTQINATAKISGTTIEPQQKNLTDYGKDSVRVISQGKIFLTNRRGMYKRFSQHPSQVNQLWEAMNTMAGVKSGVIYHVDKYGEGNIPLQTWWIDTIRSNIQYGQGESAVNSVAGSIKQMLKSFIDKSGDIGSGRYVAIIGDDAIVPFYRVLDPTNDKCAALNRNTSTVLCYEADHDASNITRSDATNNYLFTDIFYRDHDGDGWGKGNVENVHVGRIVGKDPGDMKLFLESSNKTHVSVNNVVKLENARRNCELDQFVVDMQKSNYTIVTSIGMHSTDMPPNPNVCKPYDNNAYGDDVATSNDFMTLFRGGPNIPRFDIFRAMTHGNVHGIYSSEAQDVSPTYQSHAYFTDTDIALESNNISTNFSSFYPFFIYDACLVGLTDGTQNTFLNSWAPLNPRGILASTAVTLTPYISDFNDIFTRELLHSDAGRALTRALKDYNDTTNFIGFSACSPVCSYTKFEMNLYGLPWAVVTPPTRITGALPLRVSQKVSLQTPSATRITQSSLGKTLLLDASNYTVVTTSAGYQIVNIDGFRPLIRNELTPVIPYKDYIVDLPIDASVNSVSVTFGDTLSLGQLNIPASVPPAPTLTSKQSGGYVSSPTGIGMFPASQYSYSVSVHDNKTRVTVTVFPVVFNTDTHDTILSKAVSITVSYSTPGKGFVKSFGIGKNEYTAGESIETSTVVENTSSDIASYQVSLELRDYRDNVVATATGSGSISVNSSDIIQTTFPAPNTPGSYKIIATVSDGQNQIGSSETTIKVSTISIESFTAPTAMESHKGGVFEVAVKNPTDTAATGYVDFYIYQGQKQAAQLPRVTIDSIAPGETKMVQAEWQPTGDFDAADYSIQAVITLNGQSISTGLKPIALSVTQQMLNLSEGWNFISFQIQPNDASINAVLKDISGSYLVVWGWDNENQAWKKAIPLGINNTLTSMEYGKGYWIYMKEPNVITITGTSVPPVIPLNKGWNLVGYSATHGKDASASLNAIADKWSILWSWSDGQWYGKHATISALPAPVQPLANLYQGKAYWIKIKQLQTVEWTQ